MHSEETYGGKFLVTGQILSLQMKVESCFKAEQKRLLVKAQFQQRPFLLTILLIYLNPMRNLRICLIEFVLMIELIELVYVLLSLQN